MISVQLFVSGSGGMHAGLITGFAGTQSHIPVIGINVSRGKAEQEEKVAKLVDETSAHVGIPTLSRATLLRALINMYQAMRYQRRKW